MPLAKLTLSVDEAVVEKAREYSRRHGTSISQLVSRFLSGLPADDSAWEAELTPTVRRLLGIASGDVDEDDYHRYLLEKYTR
jgi:hypothetical protein